MYKVLQLYGFLHLLKCFTLLILILILVLIAPFVACFYLCLYYLKNLFEGIAYAFFKIK